MIRETVGNYLRGLLMGGADIIPGVSGGTIALIVGIYERLVECISLVFSAVVALVRGDLATFREHLASVEWLLIVPLFGGIVTALLIGSAIIPGLLEDYPIQMRALFFGLIVGSLYIPWSRMSSAPSSAIALTVAAAVLAFVLVGLPVRETAEPGLLYVFMLAAVAICAMILPGVSGAFLLLVFGIYQPTLEAIHDRNLIYIVVFGLGAAVGLGLFSGVLNYLLKHYHDATMAVLIGLMAGSLRALWPWITFDRSLLLPTARDPILLPVLLMAGGILFVAALYLASRDRLGPHAHDA